MKRLISWTITGGLVAALAVLGQTSGATSGQGMGRGRGGAPFAWNDKDKDGVCDVTGKPVGQGRARGGARGWGDKNKDGICDYTGRPVGRGRAPANPPAAQPGPAGTTK